jgi:hypothetical protein
MNQLNGECRMCTSSAHAGINNNKFKNIGVTNDY